MNRSVTNNGVVENLTIPNIPTPDPKVAIGNSNQDLRILQMRALRRPVLEETSRFAKSAVLGFAQVEHLFKTSAPSRINRIRLLAIMTHYSLLITFPHLPSKYYHYVYLFNC
jgi:hypothetical protein